MDDICFYGYRYRSDLCHGDNMKVETRGSDKKDKVLRAFGKPVSEKVDNDLVLTISVSGGDCIVTIPLDELAKAILPPS